jgi:hypothetical protein
MHPQKAELASHMVHNHVQLAAAKQSSFLLVLVGHTQHVFTVTAA